jgi:hypothetical protein
MRMLLLAFLLLAFAGCSGDSKPTPAQDGPVETPDAPIDSPSGNACTGAAYDPCTTNTQCASMNCHLYQAQALQVCTTTCTPGDNTTCPKDKTGAYGVCNNMANCKPAAANDCTR